MKKNLSTQNLCSILYESKTQTKFGFTMSRMIFSACAKLDPEFKVVSGLDSSLLISPACTRSSKRCKATGKKCAQSDEPTQRHERPPDLVQWHQRIN